MSKLTTILGSGFSKPAGLPLANEINQYFERDNSEKILSFGSGEFRWIDFADEPHQNNGRLGSDHLASGILLNEIVKIYINENGSFIDYEHFYQYIIDHLQSQEFIEDLTSKSIVSFKNKFPQITGHSFERYTFAINHFQPRVFKSLINHLIDDLLYVRTPIDNILPLYEAFDKFCKKYTIIDFITLNHDLLLERLIIDSLKQEFSDGFTKDQNVLKSSNGENLKVFQGSFSSKIRVIKLHGSIDIYRYIVANQEGGILKPTGESIFFKTHDYYEKQTPVRYDPATGNQVQTFHWDIDPQFITGTKKEELIKQPGIYKSLYEEAGRQLLSSECLLIVGYSYRDEHVNELIKKTIAESESLKSIINVNPYSQFPFKTDKHTIQEYKNICDLK